MTEVQARLRILRIKLGDQRQQGRKGKRSIESDRQLSLPARAQLLRLLFQISGGAQQLPSLLQHQPTGIGKLRPVARAIQQHNIQIALQLLDHIAQGGGGFIQRLRGGGEGPVSVQGIKDHKYIKIHTHGGAIH